MPIGIARGEAGKSYTSWQSSDNCFRYTYRRTKSAGGYWSPAADASAGSDDLVPPVLPHTAGARRRRVLPRCPTGAHRRRTLERSQRPLQCSAYLSAPPPLGVVAWLGGEGLTRHCIGDKNGISSGRWQGDYAPVSR